MYTQISYYTPFLHLNAYILHVLQYCKCFTLVGTSTTSLLSSQYPGALYNVLVVQYLVCIQLFHDGANVAAPQIDHVYFNKTFNRGAEKQDTDQQKAQYRYNVNVL